MIDPFYGSKVDNLKRHEVSSVPDNRDEDATIVDVIGAALTIGFFMLLGLAADAVISWFN